MLESINYLWSFPRPCSRQTNDHICFIVDCSKCQYFVHNNTCHNNHRTRNHRICSFCLLLTFLSTLLLHLFSSFPLSLFVILAFSFRHSRFLFSSFPRRRESSFHLCHFLSILSVILNRFFLTLKRFFRLSLLLLLSFQFSILNHSFYLPVNPDIFPSILPSLSVILALSLSLFSAPIFVNPALLIVIFSTHFRHSRFLFSSFPRRRESRNKIPS